MKPIFLAEGVGVNGEVDGKMSDWFKSLESLEKSYWDSVNLVLDGLIENFNRLIGDCRHGILTLGASSEEVFENKIYEE